MANLSAFRWAQRPASQRRYWRRPSESRLPARRWSSSPCAPTSGPAQRSTHSKPLRGRSRREPKPGRASDVCSPHRPRGSPKPGWKNCRTSCRRPWPQFCPTAPGTRHRSERHHHLDRTVIPAAGDPEGFANLPEGEAVHDQLPVIQAASCLHLLEPACAVGVHDGDGPHALCGLLPAPAPCPLPL
jgi:hypothetical protein